MVGGGRKRGSRLAVLGVTNGRNARIVLVLRFDEKRTWKRRRGGVVQERGGGWEDSQ